MKTQNQLRKAAADMKEPLAEFFRKHLTSAFGDVEDQLRAVGYLCETMLEMVECDLKALKLQQEMEDRRRIIVANN